MKKINLNRSEALRKPQPLNAPPEGPRSSPGSRSWQANPRFDRARFLAACNVQEAQRAVEPILTDVPHMVLLKIAYRPPILTNPK